MQTTVRYLAIQLKAVQRPFTVFVKVPIAAVENECLQDCTGPVDKTANHPIKMPLVTKGADTSADSFDGELRRPLAQCFTGDLNAAGGKR